MNQEGTSYCWFCGSRVAMSARWPPAAGAAPTWKFNGTNWTDTETAVGAAITAA